MGESLLVGITLVAVLGVSAQWLAWRIRVPSILLLLVFGFLAGPVTGFLDTDRLMGDLLLPAVSMSVALILYEGGLTLSLAELRKAGGSVWNLVTIGALITWAVSAASAYFIFDLSVLLALLLGAILVVTGPTVITPLLQHIRPMGPSGVILKWEGIVIDPIGALLAVLVFEAAFFGRIEEAPAHVAMAIAKTVVLAGGLGLLAAAVLTLVISRYWVPDFLQNAVSLMFVVAAFAGANAIQHESGLFAATVMGIALANQKFTDVRHIVEFKENLRVLLISALFILLAARISLDSLSAGVLARGALFVVVLVVVARPLSVWLSTRKSKLKTVDRLFIAGVAPRGIVAAAVASVFALRLEQVGYQGAQVLVPATFLVIIGTVAIYGLSAPALARLLKVADPNPQGVLIVGAGEWARALGKALMDKGFRVLLVDTNRALTAKARMAGLPSYTGSVLAEYALEEIDLGGIGRVMAVTPNDWVNVLAVQRFIRIFGRSQCFQLSPQSDDERQRLSHKHLHGRWLFGENVTHASLASAVASGAVVKATRLSESFDWSAFKERYGKGAVPLMLITEEGKLEVVTAGKGREPRPGQTLVAMVKEPAEPARPTGESRGEERTTKQNAAS